ncbi:MAG: thioesterase [Clostridia bacterium]|nr:thioesterase [Clostridia bacterium]MDD4376002.1 thioesterase [Clostridia bacterium]
MKKRGMYQNEYEVNISDIGSDKKMKLSSFLKYLQEVAAIHSGISGYGINNVKTTRKAWVVLAWKVNIIRKPIWNEKITVKTWSSKIEKIYYYRNFEIKDEKGEVICTAESQWIMMDVDTKKIQRITEEYLDKFIVIESKVTISKTNVKLTDKEKEKIIHEFVVARRDVDTNNHMNNIIYLDMALEGLDEKEVQDIKSFEICYKLESKIKDKIICTKVDDENTIYLLDENKEKIHAIVKFK